MTRVREPRNQKQKRRQFEHQKGLCCWCLKPMDLILDIHDGKVSDNNATWEHVIPKALGGVNLRENRVLAHSICNRKRGKKIITPEFRPYEQPVTVRTCDVITACLLTEGALL